MKKKRTYLYIFSSLFLLTIICNQVVIRKTADQIYSDIEVIPFRKCGLVLGTSKDGANGLNPYFTKRMTATIDLYNAGKIKHIIVSGDNHTSAYNEPQDMCNYLVERGVNRADITLDYAGFRTLDSVVRAKKVFSQNEITIISQEFHNQRALYIANHFGIDAVAYNAADVSSKTNLTHLREYLAKILVIMDLHVFSTSPKFL